MRTKAIIYDLGDIFFEAHLWRKWLWKEFKKRKLFSGSFSDFYLLYDGFLSDHIYTNKGSYRETFNLFLEKHATSLENRNAFVTEAEKVKKALEDKRTLYPEVKETLRRLQISGIKNIVLSDNESTGIEIKNSLEKKYNVGKFLFAVITSLDTGVTKPDKRMFEKALKKAGCYLKEALFVGHDKDEITGAKKYGLKTIELNNYLGAKNDADIKISSFKEILEHL